MLEFSWDERKRKENLKLRKVDFAEAARIFRNPDVIEAVDNRKYYGEERRQALGETDGIDYLVVYTWRGDTRHIITAWKVGEHGKKRYQALFMERSSGYEGEG